MLDDISEVLEPNAAYYKHGGDEWVRYSPDPELLSALAFILTSVVVPILTNILSAGLIDRLKGARASRETVQSSDLEKATEEAAHGPKPSEDARAAAVEAASAVLQRHGWPPPEAEADADAAVQQIVAALWGDEECD
jgi:hypothetical protein